MSTNGKVKVIPCSGMGKVYGLMAREAALHTASCLCPGQAETMCLAYIVTGDAAAEAGIANQPCITVDGCPAMCSAKSVGAKGGDIKAEFKVLDIMKLHKGAKPGTATELTADGWSIVDEIAVKLEACILDIQREGR
ncbi:dgc [Lucifera butyrica]|uniref:Dgc n=1 Tax=Lucifera butyrica TaxID=1351585 RepID=A0A498RFM1_9FIRM|nr:putative zinc-binding protein [Lucifera butyrica]VBB08893.1 dgc [Lucifera butyrica]